MKILKTPRKWVSLCATPIRWIISFPPRTKGLILVVLCSNGALLLLRHLTLEMSFGQVAFSMLSVCLVIGSMFLSERVHRNRLYFSAKTLISTLSKQIDRMKTDLALHSREEERIRDQFKAEAVRRALKDVQKQHEKTDKDLARIAALQVQLEHTKQQVEIWKQTGSSELEAEFKRGQLHDPNNQ